MPTGHRARRARPLRDAPFKLGLYCPGTGTGGPWRYAHSILAGLSAEEFDVTLYCDLAGEYEPRPHTRVVQMRGGAPVAETAPAHARVRSTSVTHRRVRQAVPYPVRLWAGFTRTTRELASQLRQNPVDLFHTQNTGCEESPVAARLAGMPRILGTFHVDSTCDVRQERSGLAHRLLEVVSNWSLDAAVAVSEATRRDWIGRTRLPDRRVITIHNGINPEKFRRRMSREAARRALALPAEALIVGGVGRLEEVKGFSHLLKAVSQLRPGCSELFTVIAGDGPLREALEQQALHLGIADRTRFLGFRRDVQCVLDALDVFVLPSLSETLGYALMEAMASELPAVGTMVGGIPEVIVPGKTGFLVPPRDPAALAAALRTLLDSAALRGRMGKAGRERVVRHFNERHMVSRTLEIYRNMLRAAPRRASTRGSRAC